MTVSNSTSMAKSAIYDRLPPSSESPKTSRTCSRPPCSDHPACASRPSGLLSMPCSAHTRKSMKMKTRLRLRSLTACSTVLKSQTPLTPISKTEISPILHGMPLACMPPKPHPSSAHQSLHPHGMISPPSLETVWILARINGSRLPCWMILMLPRRQAFPQAEISSLQIPTNRNPQMMQISITFSIA